MTSATVVLDVEGVLFKTRISTLTSAKGSYFDKFFEGNWRKSLDKEGHVFVDRDASAFRFVLNFLRDGEIVPLPRDELFLQQILREAKHFQISDLQILVARKLGISGRSTGPNGNYSAYNTLPILRSASSKPPLPPEKPPIPVPMRKSDMEKEKKNKVKKAESISLPHNFTHIAHVGWNGSGGVVLDNRTAAVADDVVVQRIADAASEAVDLDAVYNVVNGDGKDGAHSHSVEVIISGGMMQSRKPPSPRNVRGFAGQL